MKTHITIFIAFFFIFGCEEQKAVLEAADCAVLTSNFTAAGLDYSPDDPNATAAECQAVNDAYLALWDAGCEGLTQSLESLSEQQIEILRDGSSCDALHSNTY